MKESGLGQTDFAIIPKKLGFLPYPLIFIHRYIQLEYNVRLLIAKISFLNHNIKSRRLSFWSKY